MEVAGQISVQNFDRSCKMFDMQYELGRSFVIQLDPLSALSKIDEMLRLLTMTDGNKL